MNWALFFIAWVLIAIAVVGTYSINAPPRRPEEDE